MLKIKSHKLKLMDRINIVSGKGKLYNADYEEIATVKDITLDCLYMFLIDGFLYIKIIPYQVNYNALGDDASKIFNAEEILIKTEDWLITTPIQVIFEDDNAQGSRVPAKV